METQKFNIVGIYVDRDFRERAKGECAWELTNQIAEIFSCEIKGSPWTNFVDSVRTEVRFGEIKGEYIRSDRFTHHNLHAICMEVGAWKDGFGRTQWWLFTDQVLGGESNPGLVREMISERIRAHEMIIRAGWHCFF